VNRHEQGLAARRMELVQRSTVQRAALLVSAEPLVRKAGALDRVVTYVRTNPVFTAVAIGALALIGPKKIFDLGARALTLYALLRR
jgi:hypothetical protein